MTKFGPPRVLYQVFPIWGDARAVARQLSASHGTRNVVLTRSADDRTAIFVSPEVLVLLLEKARRKQQMVRKSAPQTAPTYTGAPLEGTPVHVSSDTRTHRMLKELAHVCKHAPPHEISTWVRATALRFGRSLSTRVGRVVDFGVLVLEVCGREVIDLTGALIDGRAMDHLSSRRKAISEEAASKTREIIGTAKPLVVAFQEDPAKVGPAILVGSLAAITVSGGFDGDGGAPDLDIALLGIEAHRSLFTHSIVAGAIIETGLLSLVDLIQRAHGYLPPQHDPLWDTIKGRSACLGDAAARGASVGLAYHLGIDGLVQPAPYHDIPFSAPLEVHQGILTVNAAAEAGSAVHGPSTLGSANGDSKKRDWNAIGVSVAAAITAVLFWG